MTEIKATDEEILKKLKEGIVTEKISTKKLAQQLEKEGTGSEHYLKQRLHMHREYFAKNQDKAETFLEEDDSGGHDTRYWRPVE